MARETPSDGQQPSLLDRLTDPASAGQVGRRGYTMPQMMAAVQRDLEYLMNTRRSYHELPEGLKSSVLGFGLPDLVSLNSITPEQCAEIGRDIEEIVQRFEPRLKNVQAILVDFDPSQERSVRFTISAQLNVADAPDVAFETVLELMSGHYVVRPS